MRNEAAVAAASKLSHVFHTALPNVRVPSDPLLLGWKSSRRGKEVFSRYVSTELSKIASRDT